MAHHSKAKWQTNCHGLCLESFEDGDIVIETDFIEKYTHEPQAVLTCARHDTTTLMVAMYTSTRSWGKEGEAST